MVMVRRRKKHRHTRVVVIPAPRALSREMDLILLCEDPDDRAIREAHSFIYDDDFEDRSLLCRNGCGNTYFDIAVGKMRECQAATPS